MLAVERAVPDRLLGIFVKQPVVGQVKTRLCPPLQPEEAAQLYEVAMQETIERFAAGPIPVVLFYAGSLEYFSEKFPALPSLSQPAGDLGQRMTEAMAALHETGCQAAALIGSDSPDLPYAQVEAAFALLVEQDVVTIPASDGGYVLVGNSRPCPEIFQDVPWSTAEVLTTTRKRAEQYAISYCESGGWDDVDDRESLLALVARTPESATACFIRQNLQHCLMDRK